LSIFKKICAPSESAQPDPKGTAAGSTESGAISDQLTDVGTVIDLLTNTKNAAGPNTRSLLVVHLTARRPSLVHSDRDSEAVGPLASATADAARFKGGVTSADLLTDPTRLPSTCSGPEYVGPFGDMVVAGGHRPGRFKGAVTAGDLLTTTRAAVDPLAELQSWIHTLSAATASE
jgi:hypothetical protein